MINTISIDHTVLQVKDLSVSSLYLKHIFNFDSLQHPKDKNSLAIEGKGVHFFLKKREFPPLGQHISFEVNDLDEVKSILDANRIQYAEGDFSSFRTRNYHWVEWYGSDNIRFECVKSITV